MASNKGTKRSIVPLIVMLIITALATGGYFYCTRRAEQYTQDAKA